MIYPLFIDTIYVHGHKKQKEEMFMSKENKNRSHHFKSIYMLLKRSINEWIFRLWLWFMCAIVHFYMLIAYGTWSIDWIDIYTHHCVIFCSFVRLLLLFSSSFLSFLQTKYTTNLIYPQCSDCCYYIELNCMRNVIEPELNCCALFEAHTHAYTRLDW